MGDVTKTVFKLNGRVLNVELRRQNMLDPAQDHVALGKRDIVDPDMTGKRMRVGAYAPHVDIVNINDAIDYAK